MTTGRINQVTISILQNMARSTPRSNRQTPWKRKRLLCELFRAWSVPVQGRTREDESRSLAFGCVCYLNWIRFATAVTTESWLTVAPIQQSSVVRVIVAKLTLLDKSLRCKSVSLSPDLQILAAISQSVQALQRICMQWGTGVMSFREDYHWLVMSSQTVMFDRWPNQDGSPNS